MSRIRIQAEPWKKLTKTNADICVSLVGVTKMAESMRIIMENPLQVALVKKGLVKRSALDRLMLEKKQLAWEEYHAAKKAEEEARFVKKIEIGVAASFE